MQPHLQCVWTTQLCLQIAQLLPPQAQLLHLIAIVLYSCCKPCSFQQAEGFLAPPQGITCKAIWCTEKGSAAARLHTENSAMYQKPQF